MEHFILENDSKLYIVEDGGIAMFVLVRADGSSEMVIADAD